MSLGRRQHLCIVRAPHQYRYDVLNVAEEPIIGYLLGYFEAIGFSGYEVFDFHLHRGTTTQDLLQDRFSGYVFSLRETGENTHYVRRLCRAIAQHTDRPIWIFGQVARLGRFDDWPPQVRIVHRSERHLAEALGLPANGPDFENGLRLKSYARRDSLNAQHSRRFKGVIETTRGCHFGCSFCFINQGKNYDKRWQVRPNEAILADLRAYRDAGVRDIVFYDSEFIGNDPADHAGRVDLLARIADELPGTRFKIYCRADTLLRFGEFDLLKRAGLVQVFIGAESLHQPDLDALKKRLRVETILACIEALKSQDIYCNLSFIVFNRNTTLDSLQVNLDRIDELLKTKPRLLGVPSFTFSFESDWRGKAAKAERPPLSSRTYIGHDLAQKEQPFGAQIFDAALEPLMELYRLLAYEWSKKLVELNLARDFATMEERAQIGSWFAGLGKFCATEMRRWLDLFRQGRVTLDNLDLMREELFLAVRDYYDVLPLRLRELVTYAGHASSIDYQSSSERLEDDEYWLLSIPA